MGDFSDDYGGYDILGLYEQRDKDLKAQRAKLLTLPKQTGVLHIDRLEQWLDASLKERKQREWVGLTDVDWEWVAGRKDTSLDTFAHGAAWAADKLKELNK